LSVVFFTDRDLGIRFPGILKAAGLSVELHRDHFKRMLATRPGSRTSAGAAGSR
jgi:hypothetical protein